MNSFRLIYTILSALLTTVLISLAVNFGHSKRRYVRSILKAIIIGAVIVPVYALFFYVNKVLSATIIDTIYFIGTIWLAFFVFRFCLQFTEMEKNPKKYVHFYIFLGTIDSISLIINLFTHHSFYLEPVVINGFFHSWSLILKPAHLIHLCFCYVMVLNSFGALVYTAIKSPHYYKSRYVGIIIAYGVVIITNLLCYSLNLPVDVAVLLYGVLAAYCIYYSAYKVPNQMLIQALKTANDSFGIGMVYFNAENQCIYANPYVKKINYHGISFTYENMQNIFKNHIAELSSDKKYENTWKDNLEIEGENHIFNVEYKRLIFADSVIGSYLKFTDITNEEQQIEKQKYLAQHDALTGLYNREKFFEEAGRVLKAHPKDSFYMIASNIKDFKLINEIFSRKIGDSVLRHEAELIREKCRQHEGEIFGRIGEDKFAILMRVEDFDIRVFEACRIDLCQMIKGSKFSMRVVFGICPSNGFETPQVLYDKARIANKSISLNYQRFYTFYNSELMEKMLIEKNIVTDFADGIRKNEFKLYLQPVFDFNKQCRGSEILVYWEHHEKGLFNPNYFLSVLENSGLIHILDAYVWEEAVKIVKLWQTDPVKKNYYISLNVSTKDIYYMDIYQTFVDLVEKYQVPPELIRLEFKETLLTSDFETAKTLLHRLQEYGFKTGIDNFGRGYSSLNLLKDVSPDFLKVDVLFLSETENSERSVKILKFIVTLAKTLNMTVISQGVEDKAEFDILKKMDCDFCQGYYLSKQMLLEDFNSKF